MDLSSLLLVNYSSVPYLSNASLLIKLPGQRSQGLNAGRIDEYDVDRWNLLRERSGLQLRHHEHIGRTYSEQVRIGVRISGLWKAEEEVSVHSLSIFELISKI